MPLAAFQCFNRPQKFALSHFTYTALAGNGSCNGISPWYIWSYRSVCAQSSTPEFLLAMEVSYSSRPVSFIGELAHARPLHVEHVYVCIPCAGSSCRNSQTTRASKFSKPYSKCRAGKKHVAFFEEFDPKGSHQALRTRPRCLVPAPPSGPKKCTPSIHLLASLAFSPTHHCTIRLLGLSVRRLWLARFGRFSPLGWIQSPITCCAS